MSQDKSRIVPLDPAQWSEHVRRVLGGSQSSPSRTPKILMTIAHQPELLEPFLGFAAALAMRGVLTRRDSELLALRAAWNCQSGFEWGHHVLYARQAGLSDDEIAAIALGPETGDWSIHDRALLQAADELHETQDIGEATWEQLSAHWNSGQLVEIAFVVGNYTMLSMVANATRVPLEPDLPPLPAGGKR